LFPHNVTYHRQQKKGISAATNRHRQCATFYQVNSSFFISKKNAQIIPTGPPEGDERSYTAPVFIHVLYRNRATGMDGALSTQ
jgi:hypothetical protein